MVYNNHSNKKLLSNSAKPGHKDVLRQPAVVCTK